MRSALAFALVLIAPASLASTITTALTGRISSGGKPVSGATVVLTSTALQHQRITRTGSYGTYWLAALPPGVYDVTFSASGLQTMTRRATIELGRVARADAVLEPSEDEEHVTSTAKTISVGDTTAITTHFSDWLLDRLPMPRNPLFTGTLVAGPSGTFMEIDSTAPLTHGPLPGEESIDQATAFRAGFPLENDVSLYPLVAARTRSGTDAWHFTLRDSITSLGWVSGLDQYDDGTAHLVEGSAGGRLIRDRLWLFAEGWSGEEATIAGDGDGYLLKLIAQIGASHNVVGTYIDLRQDYDVLSGQFNRHILALHYTGALSPRLTIEAAGNRVQERVYIRSRTSPFDRETVFAKLTYVLPTSHGDHVLTAGGSSYDVVEDYGFTAYGEDSLFVNDRWTAGRWIIEAGVRTARGLGHAGELDPRLAVVYDLRGDGRHAVHATVRRPTYEYGGPREYTLGYVAALGSSGALRADAIHTWTSLGSAVRIDLDTSFRLFDRLEAGANASHYFHDDVHYNPVGDSANAWLSVDLPFGERSASATILQRYRTSERGYEGSITSTDVGLRYRMPVGSTTLTLATDVTNAFNVINEFRQFPRALRIWLRLSL